MTPPTTNRFGADSAGRITFGGLAYPNLSLGTTKLGLARAEAFSDWLNGCIDTEMCATMSGIAQQALQESPAHHTEE